MLKKFSWGHGIVLALGSFIAFILFLIFIFPTGKQNSDLISKNYYEEELLYQDVIDAKNKASQLAEKPVYSETKSGIVVSFPQGINADDKIVDFFLFRTDDSNLDIKKTEKLDSNNHLTIPTKVLVPGSYTLKIKWKENKENYQIDYDILWK